MPRKLQEKDRATARLLVTEEQHDMVFKIADKMGCSITQAMKVILGKFEKSDESNFKNRNIHCGKYLVFNEGVLSLSNLFICNKDGEGYDFNKDRFEEMVDVFFKNKDNREGK